MSTDGQFLKNKIAKFNSVGDSFGLLYKNFIGCLSDSLLIFIGCRSDSLLILLVVGFDDQVYRQENIRPKSDSINSRIILHLADDVLQQYGTNAKALPYSKQMLILCKCLWQTEN